LDSQRAIDLNKERFVMKAMGIALAITLAACNGAATSSGSLRVQAISAGNATFAPYRTFGFRPAEAPPSPYEVSLRSFEVERRVRDLVATTLAHKGYAEAGATPDFLVRLSSGTVEEAKPVTAASDAYGGEKESVTSAEVVVDAFDGSTAEQVWHGTARAEVDPARINEVAIRSAVDQMLARFPARSDVTGQR
jgi:Domain of unknown function (DUF4136)